MKLCMGCMNQIDDAAKICPICNYSAERATVQAGYLFPGTRIKDRYVVGKAFGYNGTVIFYVGYDLEENRRALIREYVPNAFAARNGNEPKIMIKAGASKATFEKGLENFLNEAEKIQSLGDTPCLEKVYDAVPENDTGYVITEYLEGQKLKDILASGKFYTPQEASSIVKQILQALRKLHTLGIIHYDISPDTIMITQSGKVILTDFGSTKYVTIEDKDFTKGLKKGFAPEEMYRADGERGPWTDVYSVAAVMYNMITGNVPDESVDRKVSDDLREPSKDGVSIPGHLENALMNALNVHKEKRTPSADAFLNDLNASSVKRVQEVKQSKKKTKAPILPIILAVIAVAAIAGGALFFAKKRAASSSFQVENLQFPDLSRMTEEEGKQAITAWAAENNLNDNTGIQVEYMYNPDATQETVIRQEPAKKAVITQNSSDQKIYVDESGTLQGFIRLYLESPDKISYKELSGLNAYSLAKKQKRDLSGRPFLAVNNAEVIKDAPYYEIMKITLNDGTLIRMDDVKMEKDSGKFINLAKVNMVEYAAGDFYYWDSFNDYVGTILAENTDGFEEGDVLATANMYKKSGENESDRQLTPNGQDHPLIGAGFIDASYFSFTKKAGEIVKQYEIPLVEVDSTKLDKYSGTLLDAIIPASADMPDGGHLAFEGFTAGDFKEKLIALGFPADAITITGDDSQPVIGCVAMNGETEVEWFKPDNMQGATIEISAEKKPEPKPEKSSNKGSGKKKSSPAAPSLPSAPAAPAADPAPAPAPAPASSDLDL